MERVWPLCCYTLVSIHSWVCFGQKLFVLDWGVREWGTYGRGGLGTRLTLSIWMRSSLGLLQNLRGFSPGTCGPLVPARGEAGDLRAAAADKEARRGRKVMRPWKCIAGGFLWCLFVGGRVVCCGLVCLVLCCCGGGDGVFVGREKSMRVG